MQLLGSITIGSMGLFLGKKGAEVHDFLIVSDLSHPPSFAFWNPMRTANALHPCLIVMLAVGPILAACGLSEICKAIVCFYAIYMINVSFWFCASHIKPRKPMGRIRLPINFDVDISLVLFLISRPLPNLNFWAWQIPQKLSRFWVIMKDRCQVCMFHRGILPDFEMNCKN